MTARAISGRPVRPSGWRRPAAAPPICSARAASLIGVLLELGADRLLFAADYPFEEMADCADWFDAVPISESDRLKIGRTNAQRLLGL